MWSCRRSASCIMRCLWFVASLMMGALLTPRIEAQTVAARDKVILVGGKVLQGWILLVSNEHVVLREGSVDRTFPRKVVQSIESVAVRHRELLAA